MKDWTTAAVSVLIAIIGVAIISVLVSPGGQTGNVLTTAGKAISKLICIATSPVTRKNCGSLTENVTSTITFGDYGSPPV